ncbi:MAG: glycosyltransferase [Flavobacterium sp.]|nr:MAG: glycosyltransferase [Flavobacterium sp.]
MDKASTVSISIIIPTYNAQKTLRDCLESIIKQDTTGFEVWIIDAESTDETISIVEEYKLNHPFIHYISEGDDGIYDAMNKGILKCNGDWIYFLGSDDILYNNSVLSKIKTHAKQTSSLIIYGNVIMRGKNQWNLDNVVFNGEYNLEKMLMTNMCHQSIFYHKTIFHKFGNYNLDYISSADQDFNLRCYANTTFEYLDIIIANFFVGGHSTLVEDIKFNQDRGALWLRYFGKRIFNKSFLSARLYIQKAAFSLSSPLNLIERFYCLIAYLKLKIQSIFI